MSDKVEEVMELLDNPVTCLDGQIHSIDENHRRYLASQICQLFSQPEEAVKAERKRIVKWLRQYHRDEGGLDLHLSWHGIVIHDNDLKGLTE